MRLLWHTLLVVPHLCPPRLCSKQYVRAAVIALVGDHFAWPVRADLLRDSIAMRKDECQQSTKGTAMAEAIGLGYVSDR